MVEKFEDRLDGLRRYGFSLVTGLLSADAVIGQVTGTMISTTVKIAVIFSTGLLVFALWLLDRDYRLYQKSASGRARTVEGILRFRLQREVDYTYRTLRMWRYVQLLYSLFLLATLFLGLAVLLGESFWLLVTGIPALGLLYIWIFEPRISFFAYGSDMNPGRMGERIGRQISGEHATLIGYELKFNKVSKENSKFGFANIEPEPGSEVQGVLYNIHESDLVKLDGFEGYPSHYGRQEIEVKRDNGKMVEAQGYIANPRRVEYEKTLKVSPDYLGLILGAKPKVSDSEGWKAYLQNLQLKAIGPDSVKQV